MTLSRGRTRISKLIDPGAIDGLLRTVEQTLPGVELSIEPPPENGRDRQHLDVDPSRRVLLADGEPVATLVASGSVQQGALDLVAAGFELALGEAVGRRALALEALEGYRELSLLYRVAETIGTAIDVGSIGPGVVLEAQRVLRADAAAVVPAKDALASPVRYCQLGASPAVRDLLADGQSLIARIQATGNAEIETGEGVHGTSSRLAAPLQTRGQVLGVIILGRGPGQPTFTAGDLKLVVALAQHAAIAYERASLQELNTDRLRMEHELALGRRIQVGLMPRVLPQPPGWEFAAAYEPAREVGGDFYDVFPARGRSASLGIVIADVTGKGIAAALLMADAKGLLRAAADQTRGPAEALERVNSILFRERRTALFITVFLAVLQLRTGELRYVTAGHELPLIMPADGSRLRPLEAEGPLLGAFPRLDIRESTTRLAPGDLLVGYTDGVTDARSADGKWFGDDRLRRIVRRSSGRSAEDVVRRILESVHAFQGPVVPADDVTLLAVRRVPSARRA